MTSICCFGICVPLNLLWPVLLLFLKPLLEVFNKTFGKGKEKEKEASNMCCDVNGVCTTSSSDDSKTTTSSIGTNSKTSYKSSFDDLSSLGPIVLRKEHDLRAELSAAHKTVVLRFTAPWCKPCKEVEPLFNSLCASSSTLIAVSVDVDEHDEIAAEYRAVSIPLFVALRRGAVLDRYAGKDEERLKAFLATAAYD